MLLEDVAKNLHPALALRDFIGAFDDCSVILQFIPRKIFGIIECLLFYRRPLMILFVSWFKHTVPPIERGHRYPEVRKAIWNSVLFHPLGARITQERCATRRAGRGSHPCEGDGNAAH
jgi:hypothetical protein